MRWYTLVALGLIVLAYLVVGGIIFSAIESGNEAAVRTQMLQQIQTFLGKTQTQRRCQKIYFKGLGCY